MAVEGRGGPIYSVLAADVKPSPIEPTALLVETDTQNFFVWDGAVWTQIGAGGGGATPPQSVGASETSVDTLGAAEILLLSAPAITLVNAANAVIVSASCEMVKDAGGSTRIVTLRIRRGTLITDPLLAECRLQLSPSNTIICVAIPIRDAPGGVGPHTYSIFGLRDGGAPTAEDKTITVIETT